MKFEIILQTFNYNYNYYLNFNGYSDDNTIAKLLDLTIDKYIKILKKYNAYNVEEFMIYYFFKNKEDAEKAIKELEPYAVMASLMENVK